MTRRRGRPPEKRRVTGRGAPPGPALVYGRNPVREALRGPREVGQIWCTRAAIEESWLPDEGVRPATDEQLAEIAGSDAHQGVCAHVSEFAYADADELLRADSPLLVALDEVTDPQNLGAVIRTAEVAGATGVVIPERRSADITPAVCKASAGAVEHLPVARVRNLADFLEQAKEAGCWSYGAAADAPQSYRDVDYSGGAILVLGAEGRGLRPRVAAVCDQLIAIPQHGRIDSLNVSAAAAVLVFEIVARRG